MKKQGGCSGCALMGKSFRGRLSTSVQAAQDDSAPVLDENTDSFAKVVESRGKGQFVVIVPSTTLPRTVDQSLVEVLVFMPPKFRNTLWVRRGSFVIIRKDGDWESAATPAGSLLKGELIHVLSAEQIKELKKEQKWPQEFTETIIPVIESEEESSNSDSDSDSELDSCTE